MSDADHFVLLGAAYHVPQQGASIDEIADVVSKAGGPPLAREELLQIVERLVAAGHIERRHDSYRASAAVIDWFGRTHRCYSGMAADAENLREYLAG